MFQRFTTAEIIQHLKYFKFTRQITQWHIHHTWKPNYLDFNGFNYDEIQQSMKDYHINTNGWSDIGQHFTLFPNGIWVAGRDLNKEPASILGWNTGSIALEMIGNFDVNEDSMTDEQRQAIYEVTEFAIEQMKLIPHFHRDNPTAYKTCPGNSIDRTEFFNNVTNFTENKIIREQALKDEQIRQAALEEARKKAKEMERIMSQVRIIFSDMLKTGESSPHWSNDYVNFLADKKIVKGIPNEDGTFRFEPDKAITRAETATLIAKTYESLEEKLLAISNALAKAGIQI